MNKIILFILLGVVGLIVAAVGVCFISYVSAHNYGVKTEASIEAKWKDNQNVLSNYTAMVKEMVQVPDMYVADLERVIKADVEGRYGPNGSSATMQWIQERQLPFDNALYTKLQQTMEAGRREFAVNQRELLDQKRVYEAALGYFWQGMWLRIAGFPKKDLSKFNIIVTSDVQQKFETGVDAPIQLRPEAK